MGMHGRPHAHAYARARAHAHGHPQSGSGPGRVRTRTRALTLGPWQQRLKHPRASGSVMPDAPSIARLPPIQKE